MREAVTKVETEILGRLFLRYTKLAAVCTQANVGGVVSKLVWPLLQDLAQPNTIKKSKFQCGEIWEGQGMWC